MPPPRPPVPWSPPPSLPPAITANQLLPFVVSGFGVAILAIMVYFYCYAYCSGARLRSIARCEYLRSKEFKKLLRDNKPSFRRKKSKYKVGQEPTRSRIGLDEEPPAPAPAAPPKSIYTNWSKKGLVVPVQPTRSRVAMDDVVS